MRAEARVDGANEVSEFVARSAGFVTPAPSVAGTRPARERMTGGAARLPDVIPTTTTTSTTTPTSFAVPVPAPIAPAVPTTVPSATTTTTTIAKPKPTTTTTTAPPTTTTTAKPKPTTTTTTVPPTTTTSTTTTTTTIPAPAHDHEDKGAASWYPAKDGDCAHRTIAKGTPIQVTNTATGATTRCRVTDAGPSDKRRIVDLAKDTFAKIGDPSKGIIQVRLDW